jgi:NAD-dependent dihydropyrimidine dehydrogenase PreA subunit
MICPDARAAPQQAPDVARSQHCCRPTGVVFINKVAEMLGSGRVALRGGSRMTYVIGEACVDVLDRACVEECPVDCIYEGERMLYIHPESAWTAGRASRCPVEAIYYEDDLPDKLQAYAGENARFFAEPLPTVRDSP